MGKWRDFRHEMTTELLLFAYMMTWVVALLVTFKLTN